MPTAEEFALYIQASKPYLVKLENTVQELGYGELDIRISVRAGVVEKMTFVTSETWLKKKDL
jgi:hypothetical protein